MVLFADLKEWLIAADLQRSQLIVIPVILLQILNIVLTLPAERMPVYGGTVRAHVNAHPQQHVRRRLLLAIDAVLVVWV